MVPSSSLQPRFVRQIAVRPIARGQTPEVRAVTLVVAGIVHTISEIDFRDSLVIVEIICEAVVNTASVKSHVRIMSEEERSARAHADIKLDAIVGVTVHVTITLVRI